MLLSSIRDEFVFHCQTRKLSPRTVRNYEKQINYLLRFLEQEHDITTIEETAPRHIKEFLLAMSKAGRTPQLRQRPSEGIQSVLPLRI